LEREKAKQLEETATHQKVKNPFLTIEWSIMVV
jgi:hypothetical protein